MKPKGAFLNTLRSMFKTSMGIMTAQALNLLLIPILARLYSPVHFSQWGLFSTLVLLLSNISTGKYADALVLVRRLDHAVLLTQLSLRLCVIVSLASIPVGFFLYKIDVVILTSALLLPISIFSMGIVGILLQDFSRSGSFLAYTYAAFSLVTFPGIFQAGLGFLGHRSGDSLLIGASAGHFLAMITSLPMSSLIFKKSPRSKKRFFALAKKFRRYPVYSAGLSVLSMVRTRAIYFILGATPNDTLLGFYSQADRVLGAPTSIFAATLRPIFYRFAAGRDFRSLEGRLTSFLRLQWIVLVPFLVFFMAHTDFIIRMLLGPSWTGAAEIFRILSIPAFILMTTNWMDRSFDVLKIQSVAFRLELIYGILAILSSCLFILYLQQPLAGMIALSILLTVYYLNWILCLFLKAGFKLAPVIKTMLEAFLFGAIISGVMQMTPRFSAHSIILDVGFAVICVATLTIRERKTLTSLVDYQ